MNGVMGREVVRREMIPHYLRVRMIMGNASRSLLNYQFGQHVKDDDMHQFERAALLLRPNQSQQDTHVSTTLAIRERRLIIDAREALDIPTSESPDNVLALLGRASLTLEELSRNGATNEADIEFAGIVVQSMREHAVSKRA